jgi:hypothetical protein
LRVQLELRQIYRFLPVLLCPYRWISTPPQVGHLTASNTIFFLLTELLLILPYSAPVNKYDTPSEIAIKNKEILTLQSTASISLWSQNGIPILRIGIS